MRAATAVGLRKSNGVPATSRVRRGNQGGIDGREFVGLNHKQVAENVAGALTGEIEVRVVGEIEDVFLSVVAE